jgi:hypothetical protein
MLKDSLLHELADADDGEIIKQVQVNPKVRCRVGSECMLTNSAVAGILRGLLGAGPLPCVSGARAKCSLPDAAVLGISGACRLISALSENGPV